MTPRWCVVKLAEVLSLDLDRTPVDPNRAYDMVGVLSFGRGLFHREPVNGSSTSYKVFYRLKVEHVVMSQLFGWEGALAVSSDEFAGLYLSPQFPTFLCDSQRLDVRFLGWLIRRPLFWQDLGTRTKGMGDRRRTLNPNALFQSEIPLPPLEEQRRIVAKLDAIEQRVRAASVVQAETTERASSLMTSLHMAASGQRRIELAEILELDERREKVLPDAEYPQVGIRAFGGGLFPKPPVRGGETTYRAFNRLFEGAVVLSQVKGWEGAIDICPAALAGYFASPEYRTFSCRAGKLHAAYAAAVFKTPWFLGLLATLGRGVGARRERARPEAFLALRVPMPEYGKQIEVMPVLSQIPPLQQLAAKAQIELDALMPAVLDRAFRGEL